MDGRCQPLQRLFSTLRDRRVGTWDLAPTRPARQLCAEELRAYRRDGGPNKGLLVPDPRVYGGQAFGNFSRGFTERTDGDHSERKKSRIPKDLLEQSYSMTEYCNQSFDP